MALRAQDLERVLTEAGRPLGVKELLRLGGLSPGQQTMVKRLLRDMVKEGVVVKEGKRFFLPSEKKPLKASSQKGRVSQRGQRDLPRVEGVLHLHPDGFGFVHPLKDEGENVFVPFEEAQKAMDHDRVVVEVSSSSRGLSGRIVKVLERRRQLVVGIYRERRGQAYVEPHEKIVGAIRVPPTQLAKDGDRVKVRLGVGKSLLGPESGLTGEVAGSLGKSDDASIEVLSIAYAQGFHDEFPAEVMDEADAFPLQLSSEDHLNRRDLRKLGLVTIDGEDARDFDDAIFVEPNASGWRLVVAVADVSHYVQEGSALDAEALRRATSVYLPGRVLPMLPERLSNGLCSLKPEEDRLCMVSDMLIDRQGEIKQAELYPAVMRSAARCTYNEVHRVLNGENVPQRMVFRSLFQEALALSRTLTAMREKRGAIDFDLPETRIELDDKGQPARMVRRDRLESHRLIEECMLAANEAVARYFNQLQLPCVYRYHGEPDGEKLATFSALAKAYGFPLPAKQVTSRDLNVLLEKLDGHPERRALNQLLLRSMMQAVYSSEEIGHYGLAAEHYLHFTSPIRRYPDLIVHRLLKAHWANAKKRRSQESLDKEKNKLTRLAEQSSERERAAMEVERETHSFYSCLLMKDRLGEEFDATVSGLSERGFFVELDAVFVEGMVKGETVDPSFRLDARLHSLVVGSGRRIKVGQACRVKLTRVNLERRQLDFELVVFPGEKAKAPRVVSVPAPKGDFWEEASVGSQPARAASPHPGFDRLRALASKPKASSQPKGASSRSKGSKKR